MAAPAAMGNIQAGRLRALGVTTGARVALLPDIPAFGNLYRAMRQVVGMASARPRTRRPILSTSSIRKLTPGSPIPISRTALSASGLALMPMTTAEFGKLIVDDIEKWGRVIRVAHIKPD